MWPTVRKPRQRTTYWCRVPRPKESVWYHTSWSPYKEIEFLWSWWSWIKMVWIVPKGKKTMCHIRGLLVTSSQCILGATWLFCIYINEISDISLHPQTKISLYADDTTVFSSGFGVQSVQINNSRQIYKL